VPPACAACVCRHMHAAVHIVQLTTAGCHSWLQAARHRPVQRVSARISALLVTSCVPACRCLSVWCPTGSVPPAYAACVCLYMCTAADILHAHIQCIAGSSPPACAACVSVCICALLLTSCMLTSTALQAARHLPVQRVCGEHGPGRH
jgi:hypothetical protein